MTLQAWERVKDLLHQAMQLPSKDRARFLDEVCGDEPSLRSEVQSLLAAGDEIASNFLASGPARALGETSDQIASGVALVPGHIFSERFKLVRKLGEGGMGQVWLAEQLSPVLRQVALKLIRAGMYDESVVQRFESERQSLAIMDHSAIAKVFDAGTTTLGQPYFVMEYVPGLPITEYCDHKKLKIADRLDLFIQACEGVQHAHQKAIIHRDLKPANILVTDGNGKPGPHIIDFGLAKAITARGSEEPAFTRYGLFLGTPGYMSPEQADPDMKDIDTRSDVYSLGAVLYVLLAGSPPFVGDAGERLPIDELIRTLREEEPPAPSVRVNSDRATIEATANARGTEPRHLAGLLEGDLDSITMKALEKDRNRRYGTPSQLAADIRRYLNHEAVSARPASVGYRLRKYARRHAPLLVGVAAVVLVLVAGAAVSTFEAIHARQARQAALSQRDLAERRFNDVHSMAHEVIFHLQNQLEAIPGTTQVRKDLVTVAINYLDALAKDAIADRALQGELVLAYLRVGDIQGSPNEQNLGDLPAAQQSYAKAERFARAMVAESPSGEAKGLLARTLVAQADAANYANQPDRAAAMSAEALALARDLLRAYPGNVRSQFLLGAALQCAALCGDKKSRIPWLEEEASLYDEMLAHDPKNPDRVRNAALAHKYVAGNMMADGDLDRAFPHLKRAQELDESSVRAAPNNPDRKMGLAIDLSQWSEYYQDKHDIPKAIQYARASLAVRRELASADPKDSWAHDRLAYILVQLGDLQLDKSPPDALASYEEARSVAEHLQTESLRAKELANSISGMGDAYRKLNDGQDSCVAYAESLKLFQQVVKADPRSAARAEATQKAYSRCPGAKR